MAEEIYQSAPFFTLRVPSLPIEEFEKILRADNWEESVLQLYQTNEELREAIALASPSLALHPKEAASAIFNYVNRMATRPTPFGLFSRVTSGTWAEKTDRFLELSNQSPVMDEVHTFCANPLLQLRGGRYYYNGTSIRANALVKKILIEAFSTDPKIQNLIQTLIKHQFLIPAQSLLRESLPRAKGPKFHISTSVADQIEKALSLLWKISGAYKRTSPLKEYMEKFVEKYGTYRTVPLLELQPYPKNLPKGEWDARWERFLSQKTDEIVLTEKDVEDFNPDPMDAPLSLDVFCKVDPAKDLIYLTQLYLNGGSSFSSEIQEELREFYVQEEALEPESIFVEISYYPVRGAAIAVHPCLRKVRLDLNGPTTFTLQDIYVGVAEDRFYLTTKDGKSEIIPRAGNRLNPDYAPAPIRFMHEVGRERHRMLYPFSWGKLEERASFLPRVRFQKVILSPAKWNLHASEVSDFTAWAKQWNLPTRVWLKSEDRYLLFDRTHPAHLNEILKRLQKGESLQFIEEGGQPWITSERGRHHGELVIPVLKNKKYKKPALKLRPYLSVSDEERWKFPGSEWLYVKFYLENEGMDEFLVQHLAPYAEQLDALGWYFVRYADPESHVRFRVKFPKPTTVSLEKVTREWMRAGLIKNMVIASYEREVERYGGVEGMADAEEVFFIDTENVLRRLRSKKLIGWEALSIIDFLKNLGLKEEEMLALLNSGDQALLKGFREHKKRLVEMAQASNSGQFSPQSPEVYDSLLHMHCNRLGCNEKRARVWARHILLNIEKKGEVSYTL